MQPYPQEKPAGARVRPRRYGRVRRLALALAEGAFRGLGGRALYRARVLSEQRLVVREERIPVAGLEAGLAGLHVVHLSDLHAGPFLGRGDLAAVVRVVQRLDPDLLLFTGDFIAHVWTDALSVLDELAQLPARLGRFAVFGNHDYRGRCEGRIAAAYAERGIHFLRNEGRRIAVGAGHLTLVGVEDVEEARAVDVESARAALRAGDVELVLCHNPMSAPIFARLGARLVLSGHTHGGQIDLPVLRRLGPQHPGLRVELGRTTLIVNRGLGVIGVPLRYRAPAEVVSLRLEAEQP